MLVGVRHGQQNPELVAMNYLASRIGCVVKYQLFHLRAVGSIPGAPLNKELKMTPNCFGALQHLNAADN